MTGRNDRVIAAFDALVRAIQSADSTLQINSASWLRYLQPTGIRA